MGLRLIWVINREANQGKAAPAAPLTPAVRFNKCKFRSIAAGDPAPTFITLTLD